MEKNKKNTATAAKKDNKGKEKAIDTKAKVKKTYSSNVILDFIMNNDKTIKTFLIGLIVGLALFYVKDMNRVTKLSNGNELVVTAKGVKITTDELYKDVKNKYAISILIDKIDNTILTKKYPTTDEITKNIDDQISSIKSQTGEENFLTTIKQYYGFNTEDELREAIALSVRREKIATKYIADNLKDNEIEKYYDDNIIGDIKASHILIKSDTTTEMSEDEIKAKDAEAKKLAEEIITKLKNGEKFEELAKKYSKDEGSAEKGGDLGYFNKGQMVSEFEEAVIKLKNGKYTTEPVKSQYGYHIILKIDQKEKEKLDTVKETIISDLVNAKLQEDSTLYYESLIKFREDNKLDIIDGNLKSQYKNLKTTWLTKNTSEQS